MNNQTPTAPAQPGKKPRDLRLDFFRGMAMFIILLAHTPGNAWTLWIPARFGFSDATEIFVFCSGMASAMAFGTVYLNRSWFLGTARICFRIWQVYWAHIAVIIATACMFVLIDRTGLGEEGRIYTEWPPIARLFSDTGEALAGFMTLTMVPGLFDILPMYLVILALVPVVMLIHKIGGRYASFAFVIILWICTQLAGWARMAASMDELNATQAFFAMLGQPLTFLNLPGSPWNDDIQWFFNPFGWQLVFFTGFAFGTGWLPAPPVKRWLLWVAALYVLAVVPFAWFQIHGARYLPDEWPLHDWIFYTRDTMAPFRWKTGVGLFRYLHFLALAYLAWSFVGPGGVKLREGFTSPGATKLVWPALAKIFGAVGLLAGVIWLLTSAGNPNAPAWFALMIIAFGLTVLALLQERGFVIGLILIAIATIPYAYIDEIKALFPALDAGIYRLFQQTGLILPENRIGMAQLAHLAAVLMLIWIAIGPVWRQWLLRDGFIAIVPIIRKVGTQSLAVFLMSIVLSRFNGWWMDIIGRDVWTRGLVNLTGFAVLIATAYFVGWIKRQPWNERTAQKPQPAGKADEAMAQKATA